jgi:hypothetical protein
VVPDILQSGAVEGVDACAGLASIAEEEQALLLISQQLIVLVVSQRIG